MTQPSKRPMRQPPVPHRHLSPSLHAGLSNLDPTNASGTPTIAGPCGLRRQRTRINVHELVDILEEALANDRGDARHLGLATLPWTSWSSFTSVD